MTGKQIHKTQFYRLFTIALFHLCFVLAVNAQCWVEQVIASQTVLSSISFADSMHGIAVGTRVLRTTNGGATWQILSVPDSALNIFCKVFMFDSTHATAFKLNSGDSYQTTDGGLTWTYLGASPSGIVINQYSFWDRNNGLFAGEGISYGSIYITSDGGENWTSSFNTSANMTSISCVDTNFAIAVGTGEQNTIVRSKNPGAGSPWDFLSNNPTPNPPYYVAFVNSSTGFIATTYQNTTTISLTTNSGSSWKAATTQTGTIVGVSFLDTKRWLVIMPGQILSTVTAGAKWNLETMPNTDYENQDIQYMPNGNVMLLQYSSTQNKSKIVLLSKTSCAATATLLSPANGAPYVLLNQTPTAPASATVRWIKPHTFISGNATVQTSPDSTFSSGNILQQTIALNSASDTSSGAVFPLAALTTYYWRVALLNLDGSAGGWSAASKFSTAGGRITGSVFRDLDRDGILDSNETGVAGCYVSLAGKTKGINITDRNGMFSFAGLDSGLYHLTFISVNPWQSSSPSDSLTFTLPYNGSTSGLNFGEYYPWNSIGGMVYHDANENGIKDTTEATLPSWSVQLITPTRNEKIFTDSTGHYLFPDIEVEQCSVYVNPIPKWEKIFPRLVDGFSYQFISTDHHLTSFNFGVEPIPPRIKIPMTFHDLSLNHFTTVQWGSRPGASPGIWNADDGATHVDFAEGEDDLPPAFAEAFDVRFIQSPGSAYEYGNGSWVDMRPYLSSTQVDTFQLSFATGASTGGSYPVTFTWSKEGVQSAFSGPVILKDSTGTTYNMKTLDSLVIADSTIRELLIISSSPVLPVEGVRQLGQTLPRTFSLEQNYPNPFNPTTHFVFRIADAGSVTLKVFDILGREIATIVNERLHPGTYNFPWNASSQPSGIYFYRLMEKDDKGKQYIAAKKLLLLK